MDAGVWHELALWNVGGSGARQVPSPLTPWLHAGAALALGRCPAAAAATGWDTDEGRVVCTTLRVHGEGAVLIAKRRVLPYTNATQRKLRLGRDTFSGYFADALMA